MDDFKTEKEMNAAVRRWIPDSILPKLSRKFVILESDKAFDIPICRNGSDPRLFFIELKCHQLGHGRLGLGHGSGGGFQVEILRKRPDYLERFLRWFLAFPERYPRQFLFITSQDVRNFLSGGRLGEKYNNIRLGIFEAFDLKTADDLQADVVQWLSEK